MRNHITGVSGFPGCRCQRETLDHMLMCLNKESREARKTTLAAFRMEGKKERIPRNIIDRIGSTTYSPTTYREKKEV